MMQNSINKQTNEQTNKPTNKQTKRRPLGVPGVLGAPGGVPVRKTDQKGVPWGSLGVLGDIFVLARGQNRAKNRWFGLKSTPKNDEHRTKK